MKTHLILDFETDENTADAHDQMQYVSFRDIMCIFCVMWTKYPQVDGGNDCSIHSDNYNGSGVVYCNGPQPTNNQQSTINKEKTSSGILTQVHHRLPGLTLLLVLPCTWYITAQNLRKGVKVLV